MREREATHAVSENRLSMQGMVTNIQRFSIHDGPGIRTTVFLKGCPLRCVWCHNPENLTREPQLAYTAQQCLGCGACVAACPHGVHGMDSGGHVLHRERCRVCGACAGACPTGALEVLGKEMSVEEVLGVAERDRPFYETSGGGVTLSGGEPLAQGELARGLLAAAKAAGLHTALDTCGQAAWSAFEAVLAVVDLWLYDLKCADPARHRELTGVGNETILENLQRLVATGAAVVVRVPVVPGRNEAETELDAMVEVVREAGVRAVDLMPYHRLAEAKYTRLGMGYACAGTEPPGKERMGAVRARFAAAGLRVTIGGG